jgi:hypothetical protein
LLIIMLGLNGSSLILQEVINFFKK